MTKRNEPEAITQRAIVAYLRAVLPPECVVHHCANEVRDRGKRAMLEVVKARDMGSVKGFPDLVVFTYREVLLFEVKSRTGRCTEAQLEMHERLSRLGYKVAVVRSVSDVRDALHLWSFPTLEVCKEKPPEP